MTPEEKHLLERTLKISEENNALLKSMRRYTRIGTIFRLLYWGLIIGVSVGAFYFIQPYVNQVFELYSGIQGNIDSLNGLGGASNSLLDAMGR